MCLLYMKNGLVKLIDLGRCTNMNPGVSLTLYHAHGILKPTPHISC